MINESMALRIDILTTFPEIFGTEPPAALGSSIPARARAAGLVEWLATDIRTYSTNRHHKTDDRPFGGGPGMVMSCQPLWDCVQAVEAMDPRPARRVLMSPQGRPLKQEMVEEFSRLPRLLIIAGHYEGIDERVIQKLDPLEVSLGDYVLSGGELAALCLIDAVVRLLPGAVGDAESISTESFTPPEGGVGPRLLDCPHYTRPREWMGLEVPEVLMSGDHARIAAWRLQERLERTRKRRPDLWPGPGGAEGPLDYTPPHA